MHAPEPAGLGSRAYAFLIDWHLRALGALAWAGVTVAILGFGTEHLRWIAGTPALAIYLLYHPVLEPLMGGQSPGKRFVHLRVVRADGTPASAGTHLARNLWRLVDGLPLLYMVGVTTMLVRGDQRRLGDLATGTITIVEAPVRRARVTARVPDHLAELLEEWLERYDEFDSASRDGIAQSLLAKAPDPAVRARAQAAGADLRAAVRDLLK